MRCVDRLPGIVRCHFRQLADFRACDRRADGECPALVLVGCDAEISKDLVHFGDEVEFGERHVGLRISKFGVNLQIGAGLTTGSPIFVQGQKRSPVK